MAQRWMAWRTALFALAITVLSACGSTATSVHSAARSSPRPTEVGSAPAQSAAPGQAPSAVESSTPESPAGSAQSSTAPATSAASSYKRYGGAKEGIILAVPAAWTSIDLDGANLEKGVASLGLTGEQLTEFVAQLKQFSKFHALFLVDGQSIAKSHGRFATNVNAYCIKGASVTGVDDLINQTEIGLASLHARDVVPSKTTIDATPAA